MKRPICCIRLLALGCAVGATEPGGARAESARDGDLITLHMSSDFRQLVY